MSSSVRKQAPPPQTQAYTEESGIECSPTACAKACGGCIMFLISLTAISALGVIAGGAFWTAQAMYNVTQGTANAVDTQFCIPSSIVVTDGAKGAQAPLTGYGFAVMDLKLYNADGTAFGQNVQIQVAPCP